MPDRETRPDRKSDEKSAPAPDNAVAPHDHPDLGQQDDPDSSKNTTARPRGHTEDPDRTL